MEKSHDSWDNVDPKKCFGTASWIGQRVEVISQKNRGEVGVIRRSGHGFYAVELDNNRGMLMKRAGELELCGATGVEDQKLWKAATILLCIAETNKQKRQKADKKRMLLAQQQQHQQQAAPVGLV